MRRLCQLPEDWFSSLLAKALERGVRQSLLAEMAVRYVSRAIDRDGVEGMLGGTNTTINNNSSNNNNNNNNGNGNSSDGFGPVRNGSVNNGHSTPVNNNSSDDDSSAVVSGGGGGGGGGGGPGDALGDLDKDVDSAAAAATRVGGVVEAGGGGASGVARPGAGGVLLFPPIPDRPVDLGQLLDTVLTTLPEDAYSNLPSLTMEWLTKVCRGEGDGEGAGGGRGGEGAAQRYV